jgi:3-hydroxyacyl-CoA dehydrogenase
LDRLTFSASFEDAAATDLVVEAVPERIDLKIRVFRDLDEVAPPETIFASNSSGYPIAALAAATNRPDRVLGWHWASPAPVMALAEIVRTRDTAESAIEAVSAVAAACGKHPVVVNDEPTAWGYVVNDEPTAWGYVANRVYFAMIAEAKRVVDAGVATSDQVDQLMMDCFRWPAGPFGMVKGATGGWS